MQTAYTKGTELAQIIANGLASLTAMTLSKQICA